MKMMMMNNQQAGGNQFSKLLFSMARGGAGGGKRNYVMTADDLSLSQSSTHTVAEASKVLVEPSNKTTATRLTRRVHFEEEHNVYYDAPSYSKKTSTKKNGQEQPKNMWADRWYSSDEYSQMKEAHKRACRKLHRVVEESLAGQEFEDSHIEAILTAYHACDQGYMAKSFCLTIGLGCENAALARTGMEQVVINAGIARGLKQRRRLRLLEQVVHLCVHEHFPSLSQQQLAELIRERCTEITEPARLFAIAIGHANAL
ncbi:hypothetical protein ACA910_008479 [Epithemia clementina (nom. ined.)]